MESAMNSSRLLCGINAMLRPERSICLPAHIQIEPVNDCNLRCLSCPRSKMVASPSCMPLEKFKEIVDSVRPAYITLSGLGETLLHPEIGAMIAYARARGVFVNMTSNGTLLDESKAAMLLDSGLSELSVSLDAADRETYRSIRGQDLWDRLMANIKTLLSLRNGRSRRTPLIRAQFVLQSRNIGQVDAFIRLCKELRVDSVYVQHLSLNGIEERREALCGGLTKERMAAALRGALNEAKSLGLKRTNIAVFLRAIDRYWDQYIPRDQRDRHGCLNPWFDAYVNVDGGIQPCCAFAGDVACEYLGNVFSTSFREVYNDIPYREFRRRIRQGKRMTTVCRRCNPVTFGDILRQVFRPR
jgi:radical SAM protein with 4Fe4S-binding SPASM domain